MKQATEKPEASCLCFKTKKEKMQNILIRPVSNLIKKVINNSNMLFALQKYYKPE
jgi:hypothetical protein